MGNYMDKNEINNNDITIIPNTSKYYEDSVKIFNDSFMPKFCFVSKKLEKQKSFVYDFGVVNTKTEDKEFIALLGDKAVGLLSLTYKEQKKVKFVPNLSNRELFEKYGLFGILKASLLGMVMTYKPPKGELYIDNLGVSKESRGLGIGTKMLVFAEDFAISKGHQNLSLHVMKENHRAKVLYEKFGFQTISYKSAKWLKKSTGYSGAFKMVKNIHL